MALEDHLKNLEAAISKLIAATEQLISLRSDAIETVKNAAAPAAKATKAAETKAAEPKAAETKPAAADPTPTTAAPAVDASVYEELGGLVAAYVGAATRPEERDARKAKVKSLFQHDQIKKPGTPADQFDTVNIMDTAIDLFRNNMQMLVAKGDLTKAPEPEPAASTSLV